MTDRDRLIELLIEARDRYSYFREWVDYLIANGVLVNKWRPASEPPKESGKYLVCTRKGRVYQTKFYSYPENEGGHFGQKDKGRSVTHWMPLPQPPKEVE